MAETIASDVPNEYVPFRRVELFTNVFENVRYLIEVGNYHPFLIGRGKPFPMIWISVRTEKGEWVRIVDGDRSYHKDVNAEAANLTDENNGSIGQIGIRLRAKDKVILSARVVGDDTLIFDALDLRPIGQQMYGENDKLHIGNTVLSRGTVHGGITIVKFEEG